MSFSDAPLRSRSNQLPMKLADYREVATAVYSDLLLASASPGEVGQDGIERQIAENWKTAASKTRTRGPMMDFSWIAM